MAQWWVRALEVLTHVSLGGFQTEDTHERKSKQAVTFAGCEFSSFSSFFSS